MYAFLAVLHDLWQFLIGNDKGNNPTPLLLTSTTHRESEEVEEISSELSTRFLTTPPASVVPEEQALHVAERAYVIADQASCLLRPVIALDTELLRLPYASEVHILRYEGRFAQIRYKELVGYVLKDALTSKRTEIYPELVVGATYDGYHEDTKRIRTLLKDAFFAEQLCLPLQSAEYVLYCLFNKHWQLPWGNERPRVPGIWQKYLRGKPGAQISIMPKTGSVMEYQKDDVWHLAHVETVSPEETVRITGIDDALQGVFYEKTFTKTQWIEFRPVWITTH